MNKFSLYQVFLMFFLSFYAFCNVSIAQQGFVQSLKISPPGKDTLINFYDFLPDPENMCYYAFGSKIYNLFTNVKRSFFVLQVGCKGKLKWARTLFNRDTASYNNRLFLPGSPLVDDKLYLFINKNYYSGASIIALDIDGHMRLNKRLWYNNDTNIFITNMKANNNHGWIITGQIHKFDSTNYTFNNYPFVLSTNSSFKPLWSKIFYSHKSNYNNPTTKSDIIIDRDITYVFDKDQRDLFYVQGFSSSGELVYYHEYNLKTDGIFSIAKGHISVTSDSFSFYVVDNAISKKLGDGGGFIAIHKLDKKTGRVLHSRLIVDTSNFYKTHYLNAFFNNIYDIKIRNETLYISCTNSNYPKRILGINLYGYPTLIRLDSALDIISAERVGLETGSYVTDPDFYSLSPMHLSDSSAFFSFNSKGSKSGNVAVDNLFIAQRALKDIHCLSYLDMSQVILSKAFPSGLKVSTPAIGPVVIDSIFIIDVPEEGKFIILYDSLKCMENPYLKAKISGFSDHYCIGDTVLLDGSLSMYADDYEWFVDRVFITDQAKGIFIPNHPGNYHISLIVHQKCFSDTSTVSFNVYDRDTIHIDTTVCFGDTLNYRDSVFTSSGIFQFISSNTNGCDSIVFLHVSIATSDTVLQDTILCVGERFETDNQLIFSDTSLISYMTSSIGCDSIVSLNIHFDPSCNKCMLKIPRAFSPNADLINDTWGIINPCKQDLTDYTLNIFNRWGELIFSSNNPQQKWDGTYKGTAVPTGVYLFSLQVTLPDGAVFKRKGDVSIIR